MALQEQETQCLQHPPLALDALYCEEESLEEDFGENSTEEVGDPRDETAEKHSFFPLNLLEHDMFWEDEELVDLFKKEKQTHHCAANLISDGFLRVARREAVGWILRVNAHYGFSALTAVLAVNYFDRFSSSVTFQRDKPWMTQLAAVTCLSLAAKVEETQVPLLLDLQVEESKYVFEARTIQKMELLVLSTLQWRMNPVTPLYFFDHITRRLGLKNKLHWKFLWMCEHVLLSIIMDSRFMRYLPSVLATATMLHVIKRLEPCDPMEYQDQLLGVLRISKDRVDDCYSLIEEVSGIGECSRAQDQSRKRKHLCAPGSPNGVIDASFSYDSSSDSRAVASSFSSSPQIPFKRSRAQDQRMHLHPLNHLTVDVLSSPR